MPFYPAKGGGRKKKISGTLAVGSITENSISAAVLKINIAKGETIKISELHSTGQIEGMSVRVLLDDDQVITGTGTYVATKGGVLSIELRVELVYDPATVQCTYEIG